MKAMIHTQFFVHVCACAFVSVNNVYFSKKIFSHCLFETDNVLKKSACQNTVMTMLKFKGFAHIILVRFC